MKPVTQDTERRIELLHRLYCEHTGQHVPFSMDRRFAWSAWLVATDNMGCEPEQAVMLVAAKLKADIRNNRAWPSALAFRRFIGDTERFCEELAACLTQRRKPVVATGRADVLRATGRPVEPPSQEAQHVSVIMERQKLASMLADWRRKQQITT